MTENPAYSIYCMSGPWLWETCTSRLGFLVQKLLNANSRFKITQDVYFSTPKREKSSPRREKYPVPPDVALERRTKWIIPGFRPVRSLLDAVGPSLLSATDLASRYGIEGGICLPLFTKRWYLAKCYKMYIRGSQSLKSKDKQNKLSHKIWSLH